MRASVLVVPFGTEPPPISIYVSRVSYVGMYNKYHLHTTVTAREPNFIYICGGLFHSREPRLLCFLHPLLKRGFTFRLSGGGR